MEERRGISKSLYATGDILGGGAFMMISLLFLNFLTNVELLSPAMAGAVLLIGKLVDAISDPLMGFISDRTKSRFGRRRIYFLLGVLPVFISFTLLWYGFSISTQTGVFWYYVCMYSLFCLAFTMVMVPYNALLPEIAETYDKRTSFMGARMAFSLLSSMLAGVLPLIIVGRFDNVKTGYLIMAAIFGMLYSIPWLLVFRGTREDPEYASDFDQQSLFKQMAFVFKNRTFRYYIAMFLSGMAAVDLLVALFIYYLTVCIGRPGQFSLLMAILMIMQLAGSQIWVQIAKKTSKTTPMKIGVPIWALGLAIGFIITPQSPLALLYVMAALCGLGAVTCNQVPWSVLPDVVDVGELITGKRQEGIYSGMATFVRKTANALMLGMSGFLLQAVGYQVPVEAGVILQQTAATVSGIRMLYCFMPIMFAAIALLLAYLYPLARKRFESMRAARDVLKEGRSIDDPAIRTDIEAITGVPEEQLWGR